MPTITFLPEQIQVEIPANASLLEAARLAGIFVETPCGGKGICAKCTVKIHSGAVQRRNTSPLNLPADHVMICQTDVLDEPVCVEILNERKEGQGQFERKVDIDQYRPARPASFDFLVKTKAILVGEAVTLDGLSDLDRFKNAVQAALPCNGVIVPLSLLADLPEKLRDDEGRTAILYYGENQLVHIVDVVSKGSFESAEKSLIENTYGIAVDIGTTTVALWLIHLKTGRVTAAQTTYNAQIECGLDVISRINYAKKYLPDLRTRVVGTINQLIHAVSSEQQIDPKRIIQVSIAANPTMVQLFLGIVPEYLRLAPYTPAVYHVPLYAAEQAGLHVNPNTPVYIAPSVGSYVGGDITSGALCTSLASDSEETVLFLDIGTNGEILLGNNEYILGCACSAGPAFEGGGIEYGMRASNGAIEKVRIDAVTGEAAYETIGQTEPIGICGSGVISVIAALFKTGLIDAAGKFTQRELPSILREGKNARYRIAKNITISESDIDNFIRAKGAIFSACRTLLKSIELSFDDLDRIYIAGGFGSYLNMEDAVIIGLLPKVSTDKIIFLGNSSLIGAYLTLTSKEYRQKEKEIANNITYIDLSNEPGYMDEYMAALFIPHTDHSLF